ncbi:MAG: DUF5686 and carboxypeptidase regulatory-like domain-containing protein [Prevotellaceae bacterium]|jgi:hypothetical protein|nr:DUF5686 and carboxypeptidase regulatory-like domain-containing protein [Prevotellaceae bacterium]
MTKFYSIFIFSLLLTTQALAQKTVVSGKIIAAENGEAMPYVTVLFEGTNVGTVSDAVGSFYLETTQEVKTLVVSSVGYILQKFDVDNIRGKSTVVIMREETFNLGEVSVMPDDSYVRSILKKVSERKKQNDTRYFNDWSCALYSKIEIDLKNIKRYDLNSKVLKQIDFIYNYMDTLETYAFLPVFITETSSDFYHYADGEETEYINATKISGMETDMISEFTGKLYTDINPYNNFFVLNNVNFVMPLNDYGTLYYKYYLRDSTIVNGQKIYEISFRPKRTQTPTFKGKMWIADSLFALTKIEMRLSETANVNFMKEIVYEKDFRQLGDKYIPAKESFWGDFNIQKKDSKLLGLIGRKNIIHKDFQFKTAAEMPQKAKKEIVVSENAMSFDKTFWDSVRPVALNEREEAIYTMVDSIKKVPIVRTAKDVAEMLMFGYKELGPVELGPYYYLYSSNEIEGSRFRLGIRTTKKMHKKLRLNAYTAYGIRDNAFKYGGGFQYFFSKDKRFSIEAQYRHDYEMLGRNENALNVDNILSSVLDKRNLSKLNMRDNIYFQVDKEWGSGFSNTLQFSVSRIGSSKFVPFYAPDSALVPHIKMAEISLNTRFAGNEKTIMGDYEKFRVGGTTPVINLKITAGLKNVSGSNYNYLRLHADINDRLPLPPLGYLSYLVQGGWLLGDMPFPLMKIHEGNETYSYNIYAFNLMNYHEFVSDRYASVSVEHHFQGFFLNRIPLIRKLQWREVVGARYLIGAMDKGKHKQLLFPVAMQSFDGKPYAEVSAGIENIFKFIRIDAVWRLTETKRKDADRFMVMFSLQFIL